MKTVLITLVLSTLVVLGVQGQVTFEPPMLVGIDGQSVSFTCTILDNNNPNLDQVFPDNSTVTITNDVERVSQNITTGSAVVQFTLINLNATQDNDTRYRCSVVTVESNIALLIVQTPVTYGFQSNTTEVVAEGVTVVIPLGLDAFPDPTFNWYFNQMSLSEGNGVTFTAGSITFSPANRANSGDYVVSAENAAGTGTVRFTLDVQYLPSIVSTGAELGMIICDEDDGDQVFNCAVPTNAGGSLTCEADGNPTAIITGNSSVNGVTLNSEQFDIVSADTEAVGCYNCFASNGIGMTSRRYNLQVGDVPSPVQSLAFLVSEDDGVATITVTFTFTDNSGVDIQEFTLEVTAEGFTRTIPLPGDSETEVEFELTITMADLDTGSYRAIVRAVNLLGLSEVREMALDIPKYSGSLAVASVSFLFTAMLMLATALLLN